MRMAKTARSVYEKLRLLKKPLFRGGAEAEQGLCTPQAAPPRSQGR